MGNEKYLSKEEFEKINYERKKLKNVLQRLDNSVKAYRKVMLEIKDFHVNPEKIIEPKLQMPKIRVMNIHSYSGFSKQELNFINSIVEEKLSKTTDETRQHLLKIHKQINERINSKPICEFCGSSDVVCHGTRDNKLTTVQKYKCQCCGAVFSFGRIANDWRQVTEVIKLHMAGYSSRDIMKELIKMKINVVHYSKISDFIRTIKPFLAERNSKMSRFGKWITKCKCGQQQKKAIMNFNYCPDCNKDVVALVDKLDSIIKSGGLYAVQESKVRKNKFE